MTITQTVEIPANRRLIIDLPPEVPVGAMARFEIFWAPKEEQIKNLDIALEKIWNLCEDYPISVDSFLEIRRQDNELEEKQFALLFGGNN